MRARAVSTTAFARRFSTFPSSRRVKHLLFFFLCRHRLVFFERQDEAAARRPLECGALPTAQALWGPRGLKFIAGIVAANSLYVRAPFGKGLCSAEAVRQQPKRGMGQTRVPAQSLAERPSGGGNNTGTAVAHPGAMTSREVSWKCKNDGGTVILYTFGPGWPGWPCLLAFRHQLSPLSPLSRVLQPRCPPSPARVSPSVKSPHCTAGTAETCLEKANLQGKSQSPPSTRTG